MRERGGGEKRKPHPADGEPRAFSEFVTSFKASQLSLRGPLVSQAERACRELELDLLKASQLWLKGDPQLSSLKGACMSRTPVRASLADSAHSSALPRRCVSFCTFVPVKQVFVHLYQ